MPATSTAPSYTELLPQLPALDALTEKVARVHGPSSPQLLEVREQYLSLALALDSLATPRDEAAASLTAAHSFQSLRQLTKGYLPPPQACRSYRGMLAGLAALDQAASPLLTRLTGLQAPELTTETISALQPVATACPSH